MEPPQVEPPQVEPPQVEPPQVEPLAGSCKGEGAFIPAAAQPAQLPARVEAAEGAAQGARVEMPGNVVQVETEDEDDHPGGSLEDPILCL